MQPKKQHKLNEQQPKEHLQPKDKPQPKDKRLNYLLTLSHQCLLMHHHRQHHHRQHQQPQVVGKLDYAVQDKVLVSELRRNPKLIL
jgi:hypothetical protein